MLKLNHTSTGNIGLENLYKQDGYVSVKHAYLPERIEEIIYELDKQEVFNYVIAAPIYNLLTVFPLIHQLTITYPLRQIVREIIGEGSFAIRAMIIDKTKNHNWVLDWHQDRRIAVKNCIVTIGFTDWSSQYGVNHVYAPLEILEHSLTARINLDRMTSENGAIFVIPKSHKGGIYTPQQIQKLVTKGRPMQCCGEKGDLMVMSPLLIHNSPDSHISESRRILSIEFGAVTLPNGLQYLT